jgi:two-component system CheB/CheR fusion protein
LQSSNEELETMNEELHSTSEELEGITVQARQHSEELDRVNRLLETIISSLRGGVIVVDRELCILAWNQRSEDTWGVRSTEALGVSLFALDIGLPVDQLQSDIQSILDGENEHMDIRMEAVNRRGKKISCRLNLYPLVSEEDGIGGVILIVEDHPI